MNNKDILSQAEIDALLCPVEEQEDYKNETAKEIIISTVVNNTDIDLDLKPGDFISAIGKIFDVAVNGTLVAKGEMIVMNDELRLRLTEVLK